MFRFRLQKVLRYRCRLRDEQSRRLHQASENLARIRQMRQGIEGRIQEQMTGAAAERRGRPDLRLWQLQSDYLQALQRQREALQATEQSAMAVVEAERASLVQVHRDVDALQRLKEQQRALWQQEQERLERKRMDEIGSQRAGRDPEAQLP